MFKIKDYYFTSMKQVLVMFKMLKEGRVMRGPVSRVRPESELLSFLKNRSRVGRMKIPNTRTVVIE